MNKDKLYETIDQEEDMTDQEKRDAYFSAIEEQYDMDANISDENDRQAGR